MSEVKEVIVVHSIHDLCYRFSFIYAVDTMCSLRFSVNSYPIPTRTQVNSYPKR